MVSEYVNTPFLSLQLAKKVTKRPQTGLASGPPTVSWSRGAEVRGAGRAAFSRASAESSRSESWWRRAACSTGCGASGTLRPAPSCTWGRRETGSQGVLHAALDTGRAGPPAEAETPKGRERVQVRRVRSGDARSGDSRRRLPPLAQPRRERARKRCTSLRSGIRERFSRKSSHDGRPAVLPGGRHTLVKSQPRPRRSLTFAAITTAGARSCRWAFLDPGTWGR